MLLLSRKNLPVALLFAGLFFSQSLCAQAPDTLTLAHNLANGKEFGKAATLLARYEKAHPTNTDAVRLHLQLLYWMNRLPEVDELYHGAIEHQPNATAVQLDYGRILYETKQYPKAKMVLLPLLQKEPGNIEALTMMGIMHYCEGALQKADAYLNKVLAVYPDNPTAKLFAQKIKAARTPYLNSYNSYRSDDQPLKLVENKVEFGSYRSALFSPSVQATLRNTQDTVGSFQQHFQAMAGNKSSLLNQQLSVQLNAGLFKHASQSSSAFVGSATLQYKLPKGFAVEAAASRLPYFYTIVSGKSQVMYSQVYAAVLYQNAKGWQGRAQAGQSFFSGSNHITGISAWVLSQAVALGPVYVKGGYSFGYNDAQQNTYSPLLSTAQIAASGKAVAGTYGAYFTPEQQMIHSLLLNADAKAGARCWISLKGSVGIKAQAQNPYLFLNSVRSQLFIDKGFYTEHYTPYEVKAQVSYSFSSHVGAEAGYVHTKAFFYTANQAFVNLKFFF